MPTLFRFTTILVLLAAMAYGAMYLLVVLVEPRQREMTVVVPVDHLRPAPDQTSSTGEAPTDAAPADEVPDEGSSGGQ